MAMSTSEYLRLLCLSLLVKDAYSERACPITSRREEPDPVLREGSSKRGLDTGSAGCTLLCFDEVSDSCSKRGLLISPGGTLLCFDEVSDSCNKRGLLIASGAGRLLWFDISD